MTGIEWMSRMIVEDLVRKGIEIAEWSREATMWEEWDGRKEQESKRSRKEKNGYGEG